MLAVRQPLSVRYRMGEKRMRESCSGMPVSSNVETEPEKDIMSWGSHVWPVKMFEVVWGRCIATKGPRIDHNVVSFKLLHVRWSGPILPNLEETVYITERLLFQERAMVDGRDISRESHLPSIWVPPRSCLNHAVHFTRGPLVKTYHSWIDCTFTWTENA